MILFTINSFAQKADSLNLNVKNSAEKLLATDGKLVIGGYGEVHYNQELDKDLRKNGKLDVHRMVMLMAYRFDQKTSFVTEIEFEHVKEVYVEQAFLQHKLNSFINLKGGLLLIPMGIVNEYHEPTSFNGVERPLVDKYIVPSTWREIGIGASGNFIDASLKYQLYLVNGFNGYDGSALLNGKDGLRKGRQKGAESYISSPAITARAEYYGFRAIRLGISSYFGSSQSSMFDGLDKNSEVDISRADSTAVGISMVAADVRYNYKGMKIKGQFYYTSISNTDQYNAFADGSNLGNAMSGYYFEASYDVLHTLEGVKSSLYPFVRYSKYNTQLNVDEGMEKNDSYNKNVLTAGLSWYPTKGAVVKSDIQFVGDANGGERKVYINAGIGVMF